MSHASDTLLSRRQLLEVAGTATAAITTLGLAGSAAAATAPPDLTPIQITLKGPIPDIITIPLDPPLLSGRALLSGQSPLLGQVALVDNHEGHVGVDGRPLFSNGVAAMTGDNGDALFVRYVQLFRPPSATGVIEGTGAFTITGGHGKYSGASGSGAFSLLFDPPGKQLTFMLDGMLATPKR